MNHLQTYQSFSDKELVDLYKSSANQQILASLFERYKGLIFGVCLKYFKNMDLAGDACNDIYIELVEKLLKYQVENVKAWLHTLAKNHCLMKLRKDKKMPIDEFPEYFMQSEEIWHPEIVQEKENKLNTLEDCIQKLKEDQKEAVSLFYLQEKSYQEIAALTGTPWNQIRSYIQNGKRNLKICMENHEQAN